jgi:hypothetical protein
MDKKCALVLLSVGIALFVAGFLIVFWIYAPLKQGSHVVKAGATLELSWYLQKGDRTEGGFTVSGGNEEASLTIKNPSGQIIHVWYAKGRYDNGFTAEDTGMYTMIFKNLDDVNDQSIGVYFRSPYEPRITVYDVMGLLMMMGGVVILFFGIRSLRNA